MESIKNFGNSDLSSSGSHSSITSKSLVLNKMDGTSLPHIIHVHEQTVDSPKTPTMIDYRLDESMKQSLGNGFDKDNVKDKEKLNTKKRFNVILPLKGETYQYPRIRVEDEEGMSVHSFSESVRDNDSSNDDGDNLDHSVTQRSVTQSFMENVHQEDFKSTTELRLASNIVDVESVMSFAKIPHGFKHIAKLLILATL